MSGADTFASAKAQGRLARLLAGLKKQDMTRDEAQCLLGLSKASGRRYIAHLRGLEQIHIVAWRSSDRGRFSPVYALGAGQDVPEPAGMTKYDRNVQEWRRVKADRDRHDRVKAVARVQYRINTVRRKPQPWFAALERA